MRLGPIPLLAVLAVSAAAVGWVGPPGVVPPGEPITLEVSDVTVVDGDTVRVRGVLSGERIRLVGFDTPEVFDPDCPDEEELGRFATASLEGMLRGAGRIELTLEPGRDAHGRGLGRPAAVDRDVGDRLIMRGLARPDEDPRGNWCR